MAWARALRTPGAGRVGGLCFALLVAAGAARAAPTAKPVPAPVSADDVLAEEAARQDVREAQVSKYRALLAATPDDNPGKAELWYQLGDLLARRAQFHRLRGVDAPVAERAGHVAAAKRWLDEAVAAYAEVIKRPAWKSFAQRDAVLFALGHMLGKAGRAAGALEVFNMLLKDHPGSRYVPDAYLAFADAAFLDGQLDDALTGYDKVIKLGKPRVAVYARYKRAWTLYNLSRQEAALGGLLEVAAAAAADPKLALLARTARRDVVRVYAELGQASRALALFRRASPGREAAARAMLAELPALYVERGRFAEAISTWHELMRLLPASPALCEWQLGVHRAQLALPGDEARVRELGRLVDLARAVRAGKLALGKAAGLACRRTAAAEASELARLWHSETVDAQQNIVLAGRIELVEQLYRLWLDAFASDREVASPAEVAELRGYAADLVALRAEKEKDPAQQRVRWVAAARMYEEVARGGGTPAVIEEAAFGAVDAWARALGGRQRPRLAEGAPAAALPDDLAALVRSYDLYVKVVPRAAQREGERLGLAKAEVLFDYHHFAEAAPLFEAVVRARKAPFAAAAARGWVDSLLALGRVDEVATAARWMLGVPALTADAALADELRRTDATSGIRRAEAAARARDWLRCGQLYREVLQRYPGDPRLPEIMAGATACYESGGRLGAAITLGEELVRVAPTSAAGIEELRRVGARYARVGYFQSAAEHFERFAAATRDGAAAKRALGDAAFFRRGLGQDGAALGDGESYVRKFARTAPAEAAEVMWGLRVVHRRRGRAGDAALVKHLERYLAEHAAAGGADRRVVALVELGDARWRMACPVPGVDGACVSVVRGRATVAGGGRVARRREGWYAGLRCGAADTRPKVTLVGRKDDGEAAAVKAWTAALALWDDGKLVVAGAGGAGGAGGVGGAVVDAAERAGREAALRVAVARARFGLGERAYEATLAVEFPEGLDFRPRKARESLARFMSWKSEREAAIVRALELYRAVLKVPGAGEWAIAATARAGQLYQGLADALITAEVPRPPADVGVTEVQGFVDGYCDKLGEQTPPIDALAKGELRTCLEEAGRRSTFGNWSMLCEAELSRLDPRAFPPAVELRVEPRFQTTTSAYTDVIKTVSIRP